MGNSIKQVYLTDKMVLFGIAIGSVYWIIDCLLYVFQAGKTSFTDRIFSPTFEEVSIRIVVLCLFLIFGAHAQYSINKRKQVDGELLELKKKIAKLEQNIEFQTKQKEN
ncbi:MAG: hypothetical protein GY697_03715 [Desulfobacterales bacterium]|nr:hypothetical protein [Desulfobacterales bacterium]